MKTFKTDGPFADNYKFLIGSILPRPIAVVSTLNIDGSNNLAPFSFFTAISAKPMIIAFCPLIKSSNGEFKDTVKNILREKEFVEAGRALGFKNGRIIMKHILPNVMGPVIVIAASNFASAILTEAGLSFLGIGAQPPTPSWGEMINAHRGYVLVDAAYLAFVPGIAIMILVLAFMLVGNGLRDALDSKSLDSKPLMGH